MRPWDSFDIVLMDLHMPRMGGMEAVRQLRLQYPSSNVPIVAVTADAVVGPGGNRPPDLTFRGTRPCSSHEVPPYPPPPPPPPSET